MATGSLPFPAWYLWSALGALLVVAGATFFLHRYRYGRMKDVRAVIAEAQDPSRSLKKTLGATDLTVLGVGAIIGAGIFVLAGKASLLAGPGIVWSFVLAGFACALAGLAYAELASTIPTSGSAYAYTYSAMGELPAWILGWALVLEYAVGATTVAIGWSGYFKGLVGADQWLPTWLSYNPFTTNESGELIGGLINLPAILIVLLVAGILIRGSKESARTTSVLVVVKVAIIVFVIAFGALFFQTDNFNLPPPEVSSDNVYAFIGSGAGVISAAAIVFFAYIGFDALSTTAEETKNPQRDLPIGILGSLAICTILYIGASIVLVGMVPFTDFATVPGALEEPFGYAFDVVDQPVVANIIRAGAITGITSVLFVMLMGAPRVFFALARDGLLPQSWATVHKKFGTPVRTTLITAGFVATAAALVPLDLVGELTSMGTLFVFTMVCVNVIVLRFKEPDLHRPFRVPLNLGKFPVLAGLGVLVLGGLFIGLDVVTQFAFFAWMGIGLMVYGLYGARASRLGTESEAPPVRTLPVTDVSATKAPAKREEAEVEIVLEEMK